MLRVFEPSARELDPTSNNTNPFSSSSNPADSEFIFSATSFNTPVFTFLEIEIATVCAVESAVLEAINLALFTACSFIFSYCASIPESAANLSFLISFSVRDASFSALDLIALT